MVQRIVRVSLPALALVVSGGFTLRAWTHGMVAALFDSPSPQLQPPSVFATQCAGCHGEDGRGTAKGPALATNPRVAEQTADQLGAYLQRGNVAAGMPSFADLPASDRA